MCTATKPFTEVHTFHFIKLHNTNQEIEEKVRQLLLTYDSQLANEATIKKTQREIQEAAEAKALSENYETKHYIKNWITMRTDYYNTMCGAAKCNSNCHIRCSLPYSFDKERFLQCIGVVGRTCKTCGHSYM